MPIRATLDADRLTRPGIARLSLTVQACNDRKCLVPEELALELPLPEGQGGGPRSSLEPGSSGVAIAVATAVLAAAGAGWWIRWRSAPPS